MNRRRRPSPDRSKEESFLGVAVPEWVPVVSLLLALVAVLRWSWGCWPDALVDFGRELYVPWRIAEGDQLYRDIAYFNGPLSPYVNATHFRIFGTAFRTIVAANIMYTILALLLVYRLLRAIHSATAALLGGLTFVAIFAVGQYENIGNSNWIAPYSHEMTHGLVLVLVSFTALYQYTLTRKAPWLAISGLALGMAFLTKAEVTLAGFLGDVVLLIEIVRFSRSREGWKIVFFWVVMIALPVFVAMGLLSLSMPVSESARGAFGSWYHMMNRELTSLKFYRKGMGIDQPLRNLGLMVACTAAHSLLLGGIFFAGNRLRVRKMPWLVAWCLLPFMALWAVGVHIPWHSLPRAWPLFLSLLIAFSIRERKAQKSGGEPRAKQTLRLAFAVLALALLAKMILRVSFVGYGFVLAMPSTVLLIAAAWDMGPALTKRFRGNAAAYRAGFLGVWLVVMLEHLTLSSIAFGARKSVLGSGADRFRVDERGAVAARALALVEEFSGPGDSFVVLPEGVMLNYLARRALDIPFLKFLPPEMAMFGEDAMLLALEEARPPWILIVTRDTSEYGPPRFGLDYARSIGLWIENNYEAVVQIGDNPLEGVGFGIVVARRTGDR